MECIAIMTTRKIPSYFSRDINDNTQNPASDSNRNNATKRFIIPVDTPNEPKPTQGIEIKKSVGNL